MIRGLDLTGTQPWMAAPSADPTALDGSLPTCLLPLYRDEVVPTGKEAVKSRRGCGALWPPEAQVPVLGVHNNGAGRVPIATCFAKLLDDDAWNGRAADLHEQWMPDGNPESIQSVPVDELIAQAHIGWASAGESLGIVVPDGLSESSQERLIDAFRSQGCQGVHLIPAPMAWALQWCRHSGQQHLLETATPGDGTLVGHVIAIDVGWWSWAVHYIPIHAVREKNQAFLVPIRDPALIRTSEVAPQGWSLWREAHRDCSLGGAMTDSSVISMWLKGHVLATGPIPVVGKCGEMDSDRSIFSWFTAMQQSTSLPGIGRELAVLMGGACSSAKLTAHLSLIERMPALVHSPDAEVMLCGGSLGALLAMSGVRCGHPTWREVVAPPELFCLVKNRHDDLVGHWLDLIDRRTLDAGREYLRSQGIRGLSIQSYAAQLRVTLRRKAGDKLNMREVSCLVEERFSESVPVTVTVSVRAGQGRAQVLIKDEGEQGRFSGRLDWSTMREIRADPATEITYGYIAQCARIEPSKDFWTYHGLEEKLEDLLDASRESDFKRADLLIKDVRSIINKWPTKYAFQKTLKSKAILTADAFHYVAAIGADGTTFLDVDAGARGERIPGGDRTGRLPNRSIDDVLGFIEQHLQSKLPELSEKYRRLAAWTYSRIPDTILALARRNLVDLRAKQIDLITAGLCFSTGADFKVFWRALLSKNDLNNNWWQAVRNLIRLNQDALKDIPVDDMQRILDRYLESLDLVANGRKSRKLRNLIEPLPYILKYRRYDVDFLKQGTPSRERLDAILSKICWYELGKLEKWKEVLEKTLNGRATLNDIMELDNESEDADDEMDD